MKINFIFIFLLISLFSFSAMEKASARYSSEISEVDIEFEFEFEVPGSDSVSGNDYVFSFVDIATHCFDFQPKIMASTDYQSLWSGIDFTNDSSLNRIYYPHGPPALV